MGWSRRRFVQGMAVAGAGVAAGAFLQSRTSLPVKPAAGDVSVLAPPTEALKSQSLALAQFFPSLTDPDAHDAPWIVNTLTGGRAPGSRRDPGARRERRLRRSVERPRRSSPGRRCLPANATSCQLPLSVTRRLDCADVLVLNESDAKFAALWQQGAQVRVPASQSALVRRSTHRDAGRRLQQSRPAVRSGQSHGRPDRRG